MQKKFFRNFKKMKNYFAKNFFSKSEDAWTVSKWDWHKDFLYHVYAWKDLINMEEQAKSFWLARVLPWLFINSSQWRKIIPRSCIRFAFELESRIIKNCDVFTHSEDFSIVTTRNYDFFLVVMHQCVAITGHSAIALTPLLRRNSIVMKHVGCYIETCIYDCIDEWELRSRFLLFWFLLYYKTKGWYIYVTWKCVYDCIYEWEFRSRFRIACVCCKNCGLVKFISWEFLMLLIQLKFPSRYVTSRKESVSWLCGCVLKTGGNFKFAMTFDFERNWRFWAGR